MSDISIVTATADDVRSLARERALDETTFGLALEAADRGDAFAARDGAETIGWALTRSSQERRYVGDLFVARSYRNRGVGTRLLAAAFADADDLERAMLLDPLDFSGFALAVRHGLTPVATLLRIAGAIPREETLAQLAAGDYRFEVDALNPEQHAFALDALDLGTRGYTWEQEHSILTRGGAGLAFLLGGEFVAYAYIRPSGEIGPIASASAAYLTQIFAYAAATARRRFGTSWCSATIPGDSKRLLRAALVSNLRIQSAVHVAANSPMPDLSRYGGYHSLAL